MPSTQLPLNTTDIERRLQDGERMTVSSIAKEVGKTRPEVRYDLVTHFGARIQFKRGRKGGIVLTN